MKTRARISLGCTVALAAAVLRAPALPAQAPTTSLVGSARDSSGRGVPGVEVRIDGTVAAVRTSDGGGFRLPVVPVGRVTVAMRRLGYAPVSTVVMLRAGRIDSLVVNLTLVAASLPGVLVEDEAMAKSLRLLPGFWERRSRGFGHFVTRDEIEARQAHSFVDIVRAVPSVSISLINGRHAVRLKRSTGTRDCPPQYWVDGMRIEQASPDEFTPQDVEAVEIYGGPATIPVQFAPRPFTYTCGAIIIWTRLPGL